MTKLQLALDFSNLSDAMKVAKKTEKYVDWVEAGTPLIKSEGLKSVTKLKKAFPKKKIVADMKTMDVGAFEVSLAAKAGADIVTVLGAADDSTIIGAIKEGKKRKVKVVVDLINTPQSKWKKIDSMKPDYIAVHVGIDQQKRGVNPLKILKKLKVKSRVIIAGGMNKERVPEAVKMSVDVIIVGGAITKAKNPEKAAKEIKEAI